MSGPASQPRIQLRYRLAVRQSVPVLTGFVGVLACLLVMGYLYTRQQIVGSARIKVEQMVTSIIKQHGYTHRWIESVMAPVISRAADLAPLPPEQRDAMDRQMVDVITDARGKQTVEVCLRDADGQFWHRTYTSTGTGKNVPKGLLPCTNPETLAPWTEQELAAFTTPRWINPIVEFTEEFGRFVTIGYAAPIFRQTADGKQKVAGVCRISHDMPWFSDRLRSFRPFENCEVFFITRAGQWTLPPDTDVPLASLKARALAQFEQEQGGAHEEDELPVYYKNQRWLAVFMPLMDDSLYLGVLIPWDTLFGSLDRLTRFLVLCGLVVLVLAAWSLHRTSTHLLSPLSSLRELTARLARGELEAIHDPMAALPEPPFPDEAQRLKLITEKIRQDLRQRVNDLTLIGRTRERLFGELTFARNMQEKLRPAPLPPMDEVEMATVVHTAENLCGDLYDYFLQSPRCLCCIMGSVTERGVPAALLMGRIGPLLHELLLSGLGPGAALTTINRMLTPTASAAPAATTMISVLAGTLDLDTGNFRWASAGQLPPLRCSESSAEKGSWLEWMSNVPLGIRADEVYQEQDVQLAAGESLFFAGQRLLSLAGADGEVYTEEHLRQFLQNRKEPLTELLPLLFADICHTLGREPQEDLTCFAIRWKGLSPCPASPANPHD